MYEIFLLALLQCIMPHNAVRQCCPEPNIVVNKSCLDGSNVTILSCKYRHMVGPTLKIPENIEIDSQGNLIISSEIEQGSIIIQPNMFCMTRNQQNNSDLAYVCYTEDDDKSTYGTVMFYIKICCALITFLFSLLTLVIYLFTIDLRDVEGMCIINFTAGLCVQHLTVIFLPLMHYVRKSVCDALGFVYSTAILFYWIWLSVIAFHVWRLTMPIFRKQIKWYIIYCLYGFGVPLLVLATAASFHALQDTYTSVVDYECLKLDSNAISAYYYGALSLILLMSIVPLVLAAIRLWINIDRRETAQCVIRLRAKCRLYSHLTALMSSVLIIDTLMNYLHGQNYIMDYFWDILDGRNLIVGAAVFLILVVFRNKVLIALAKRGLCCIKFPSKWAKLIDDERDEKDNEKATLTSFTTI